MEDRVKLLEKIVEEFSKRLKTMEKRLTDLELDSGDNPCSLFEEDTPYADELPW